MNFLKKQSIGTFVSLGACVLAIVAAIIYGVNVASEGYFMKMSVSSVVVCSVFAILLLAAVVALAQFEFEGLVGKVVTIVADAVKILVPILLAIALMALISSRVEGLAYLYFSNEDVLAAIQTPANMSSASVAITSFIMYGVALIASVVAACFGVYKKSENVAE